MPPHEHPEPEQTERSPTGEHREAAEPFDQAARDHCGEGSRDGPGQRLGP